jgi:hypothetical protein
MRYRYLKYLEPDKGREKPELIENKGAGHSLPNMDYNVCNGHQQLFA